MSDCRITKVTDHGTAYKAAGNGDLNLAEE